GTHDKNALYPLLYQERDTRILRDRRQTATAEIELRERISTNSHSPKRISYGSLLSEPGAIYKLSLSCGEFITLSMSKPALPRKNNTAAGTIRLHRHRPENHMVKARNKAVALFYKFRLGGYPLARAAHIWRTPCSGSTTRSQPKNRANRNRRG